jgi:hypothetical protein
MVMLVPATVSWVSRERPLTPSAAVACAAAARTLAVRVATLDDGRASRLHAARSTSGEALFVLRGAADDLPWIDGILYLGLEPGVDGLLLPTTRRPDVPLDVFARAIAARFPRIALPLAVLEQPRRVIAMGGLRPLDREALRHWLEGTS